MRGWACANSLQVLPLWPQWPSRLRLSSRWEVITAKAIWPCRLRATLLWVFDVPRWPLRDKNQTRQPDHNQHRIGTCRRFERKFAETQSQRNQALICSRPQYRPLGLFRSSKRCSLQTPICRDIFAKCRDGRSGSRPKVVFPKGVTCALPTRNSREETSTCAGRLPAASGITL